MTDWIRLRRSGRLHSFLEACWARLRRKGTREEDEMTEPWYAPKQGKPPTAGPPEEPPGQGPPDEPPGQGPPDEPPGQGPPGGEGPPGQNPGDGPPIPDGNASAFPAPVDWFAVFGVPWDENWWQEDYVIDVVVGMGQPPRDHYEARHVGEAHPEIHRRQVELGVTVEEYWELLVQMHTALEADMEQSRAMSHPQQRFLRPNSEAKPRTYSGCIDCRDGPGCAQVHEFLARTRGDTNTMARAIRPVSDDEINGLMNWMHQYMTCVRSDIWTHERAAGTEKGLPSARQVHVEKPYDTLESLPDAVKKLPKGGQRIYRAAFNASYEEYGEQRAHAIAWAAVKNKYEQRGGRWVAKEEVDEKGIRNALAWIAFDMDVEPAESWIFLGKGDASWYVPILKADEEKRLVYGVVLEPGDPEHADAQGDWVRPEEIEAAAQDFMKRYGKQQAKVGLQHREEAAVDIVESSILQQDTKYNGAVAKAGSWVLGVYVRDEDVWQAVKAKELTGFSIGGSGERVEAA